MSMIALVWMQLIGSLPSLWTSCILAKPTARQTKVSRWSWRKDCQKDYLFKHVYECLEIDESSIVKRFLKGPSGFHPYPNSMASYWNDLWQQGDHRNFRSNHILIAWKSTCCSQRHNSDNLRCQRCGWGGHLTANCLKPILLKEITI